MAKITRRAFLITLADMLLVPPAAYLYSTKLEPDWIEVEKLTLPLPRLAHAFDGYRLVQISDLHVDTGLWISGLEKVIEIVSELQPDAVVITGDFVTASIHPFFNDYQDSLKTLRATDGIFAVLGNHDHWTDAAAIRHLLETSFIDNISNEVRFIQRGQDRLYLTGVDDVWENKHRLDLVLADLPDQGAAILLAHEPDYADISAATGRFDLQLSGHSHGGQVHLPFIGSPVLPPFGEKYYKGLYQVGNMYQYTSRGIGMVPPLIRFNCRPEITLFTLKSPA